MHKPRGIRSAWLTLVLAAAAMSACTSSATPPAATAGSKTAAPMSSASSTPATSSAASAPPAAPTPTYFTPTDPASLSMTGRIEVGPALQDPFSNLLMRGALREQPITLDVIAAPDYPVQPGMPATLLLGTCKCSQRGQGLHLTVEDGSAISTAEGGAVGLRGTFRPVQTAADAFLLQRA